MQTARSLAAGVLPVNLHCWAERFPPLQVNQRTGSLGDDAPGDAASHRNAVPMCFCSAASVPALDVARVEHRSFCAPLRTYVDVAENHEKSECSSSATMATDTDFGRRALPSGKASRMARSTNSDVSKNEWAVAPRIGMVSLRARRTFAHLGLQ